MRTPEPNRHGFRFTAAEEAALTRLHECGLRSWRYDGRPKGHRGEAYCPCRLTRKVCPGSQRRADEFCPDGAKALVGRDHPDEWYRDGTLVAIAHYPYGMGFDDLTQAVAGCSALGLELDIDAHWAVHACDQWTVAVVLSASGLHRVLHPAQYESRTVAPS